MSKTHIQKHVVKEEAQNLSQQLLEGDHGGLRIGVLPERTEKKNYAIWRRIASYHSISKGLRARFFSVPVDGHIFLLPGESANRFGLVRGREKMPSAFPVVTNCATGTV